ncbi:MAG: acyltransferase [Acidimicrobiia bacterium]|nr:acyltransferase [Acidimicrobiia bacterium]
MSTAVAPRMAGRSTQPRNAAYDNLKVVLVMAVIVGHALVAYGAVGSWAYSEPSDNEVFNIVANLLVSFGVLFAMGLFFLIAGLFTPRSLARKGIGRFMRDRLLRFGIPFVLYLFVVFPLVEWAGSGAPGSVWDGLSAVADERDPGPLWFVFVLLIFSFAYAGVRVVLPARMRSGPRLGAFLFGLAAAVTVGTFLVRLEFPLDSFQQFSLHLWQWPQCLGLFVLGTTAAERGWLDSVPVRVRRWCGWAASVGAAGIVTAFAIDHQRFEPYAGGWTWQAGVTAVCEGLVSVGFAVWALDRFQRHHSRAAPVGRAAGRAAYGAYILQAPVLVGLALSLQHLGLPPEVKFLIVAPLGVAISFGAAWLLSRIPGVRRVI